MVRAQSHLAVENETVVLFSIEAIQHMKRSLHCGVKLDEMILFLSAFAVLGSA